MSAATMTDEQKGTMERVFTMFDPKNTGEIAVKQLPQILRTLGSSAGKKEISEKVGQVIASDQSSVDFDTFCDVVLPLMEEEDFEAVREELKTAFRLYDREGLGYITPKVLKEILLELDHKLTDDELNDIVDEVDSDGSGSIDFDEFMEMMTG